MFNGLLTAPDGDADGKIGTLFLHCAKTFFFFYIYTLSWSGEVQELHMLFDLMTDVARAACTTLPGPEIHNDLLLVP